MWTEVAVEVIPKFAQLKEVKKKEVEQDIQKKWKGIRSCFSRELQKLKKTPLDIPRKTYVYFDLLQYLLPVVANKSTTSNIGEVSEREETSTRDEVERYFLESELNEIDIENPQSQSLPLKKQKIASSQEDQLLINLNKILSHTNEEFFDDDKHFLLSLLPELKKVPEYIKLERRMAIMSTISRFRSGPRVQPEEMRTTTPHLHHGVSHFPSSSSSPPPSHRHHFSGLTSYGGNTPIDVYAPFSKEHSPKTELLLDGERTRHSDSIVKQEPCDVIIP